MPRHAILEVTETGSVWVFFPAISRKGYVRLQGGLLIMRNSIDAIQWFATWDTGARKTLFFCSYPSVGMSFQSRNATE